MDEINFDRALTLKLKAAYTAAKKAGVDSFKFEGKDLLVAYAYYLLEYLCPKFEIPQNYPK